MRTFAAAARSRAIPASLAAWSVIVMTGGTAGAHQASATYARLEQGADPSRASYEIRIAARDLYEALALDSDREATAAEIDAGRDVLASYVVQHVTFEGDGRPCRGEPRGVEAIEDGDLFARISIEIVCPAPIHELALDYDLFYDLDPAHIGFVRVGGGTAQLTAPDDTRLVWRIGGEAPGSILDFVARGVEHILDGLDHILFLLSLLLMAVVARGEAGEPVVRGGKRALLYTVGIVTSFTVAHSLTLICAALGWIHLPRRLVESLIAASIVLVAVENAVRLDPPRRRVVTFSFGLMHGLGFAAMLRPLLPPDEVVAPLLAFNVGVELGQLGIVVLVLPLLHGAIHLLGAARYRRIVLPAGAILFGGLGAVWLVERAFGIVLLGL